MWIVSVSLTLSSRNASPFIAVRPGELNARVTFHTFTPLLYRQGTKLTYTRLKSTPYVATRPVLLLLLLLLVSFIVFVVRSFFILVFFVARLFLIVCGICASGRNRITIIIVVIIILARGGVLGHLHFSRGVRERERERER